MPTLRVTLFGRSAIQRETAATLDIPAKVQELLFYLLLHHQQAHTREALACALWADTPAPQAKKYLRQCLWQLQQTLELPASQPPLFALDHAWVAVHPDAALQVDAQQLERAFLLVRDVDGAALDPQQAHVAEAAAALYRGDLLTGWYQDWCLIERERYQGMFVSLLDKLMDFCLVHGCFDQGIGYGQQLLELDYTRESTHWRLMQLRNAAGDRTGALRQFELCARALEQEFGVVPTARTLALWEAIRAGEGGAVRGATAAPAAGMAETAPLAQVLAEVTRLRAAVVDLQHDIAQLKQALRPETP